ncbi:efflux transporter outer membrane subunit [Granulicella paludicola]|uniref:efflux transporter outer membrane subunit n=1 Tax=Granulicella paludicola TaxID=474951 RepID=UPI0021E0DDD6|nr:efflux transporter outer membrane subunit [Granulicella paludicola]
MTEQPQTPRASRHLRLPWFFAASALLAGCRVGPAYKVPVTPAPPAYKEAQPNGNGQSNSGWKPGQPADSLPRGAWWTIFNDTQLNELEPQVETANQTLRQADANIRAAEAEVRIRKADRFPTLGIDPTSTAGRYNGSPYFNAAPNFVGNTGTSTQYPVEINYEADLWGTVRKNIAAGKEEIQASAADRENILLSLQATLAMDYFELRTADRLQRLLNDTVKQYQDAVRITTNRFNGGIAPKSDVTQAETQLDAARVRATDVAVQRANYEHAIAVLIGKPPAMLDIPFSPLPETTVPPIIPAGLPSELLERRPDIAAAERRANEGNEAIGIAQAAYYPTVLLSGALGYQSTASLATVFNPSNVVYSLGPGLAFTIFDGGRRKGIKEEAIALFDRNSAAYKQSVLVGFQQVEDNLASLHTLTDEADEQHSATAAALESERIFNNRYVGGVDNYLQVITAQTTALNNEVNDIDILRRRMDSTVNLILALGGGWDRTQLPKQ